jgi:hypothetical protein
MYAFTEVLRLRNGVLGALHGTAFEALKPVVVKSNGGTVSLGRGRHLFALLRTCALCP